METTEDAAVNSGADGDADADQAPDGGYSVDVRGGTGVQVGEGNTQIIYSYGERTWSDGVAPPPLASVSGAVESPYRGLTAFLERDAPFFFGREEATSQVLDRMSRLADSQGLLIVEGASGAGKSSLLHAGVLPRLRGEGLASEPGAASWPCVLLAPGRRPLDQLALGVAGLAGTNAADIRRGLETDPASFALTARQAALAHSPAPRTEPRAPAAAVREQAGPRLLLVVDQFEQVFTQCADDRERRAFITALHAAAHGTGDGPSALVVLGMRSDFDGHCANYPELAGAAQNRYLVTPMTERQLRLAITGPAQKAGALVEEELTKALLDEVRARQPGGAGAGVLPLLSHALDQAWRSRAGRNLPLTLADYERTGGIEAAVGDSAKRAYNRLTPGQQKAARRIFTRLVTTSADGMDTADRSTRAELTAGQGLAEAADVYAVLETFAAERLLTLADDSVEISHEALLTAWPLLQYWLGETHADRMVLTRLRDTTVEWERRFRDRSYLYRGTLLKTAARTADRADADPMYSPPLSQAERDFLRASQRARRRSARRWQAAVATLGALVLIAAGLYDLETQQHNHAIQNKMVAEVGSLTATNPSLAADLLYTAYNMDPSEDLKSSLISTENQPLPVSFPANINVRSMVFSPVSQTMAIYSGEGAVTLWDVADPAHPHQLGRALADSDNNGLSERPVAFSPDGKTLAIDVDNRTLTLWDVANPLHPRPRSHTRAYSKSDATSLAFSPDSKTVAIDGDGHGGTLSLWNVADPAHPHRLSSASTHGDGNGISVAFSPDGKTLATSDGGSAVTLWNVSDPTSPRHAGRARSDTSDVTSVAFRPDAETLAVGYNAGPDGSGRDMVMLWDATDPAHPRQLGQPLADSNDSLNFQPVGFRPDGKILATGDGHGAVTLWNMTDPARPRQLGQPLADRPGVTSVAFSPDGNTLATDDNGALVLWSLPRTTFLANLEGRDADVFSVAFSPDSRTLATAAYNGMVSLWNTADPGHPRPLGRPLTDSDRYVQSVAFAPDGKTLVTGDIHGKVILWDVGDPDHPRQFSHFTADSAGAGSVTFSPVGKILAVSSDDGTVSLWDVSDMTHPHQRSHSRAHGNNADVQGLRSVAFSPDGKTLAAVETIGSDYSDMVTLWDAANPDHPHQIGQPLTDTDGAESVAFSPSGKTLAIGFVGGAVMLWDVTHLAHPSYVGLALTNDSDVGSVAFSRDGKTLATGTGNAIGGAVSLWDVSDLSRPLKLSRPLAESSDTGVRAVAFSPDGKTLVAGESDGVIQTWDLDVNYAISRICHLASAALTNDEWSQLIPELKYNPPPCPSGR